MAIAPHRAPLVLAASVGLLGILAGCGDEDTSGNGTGEGTTIVATTSIWADIVQNVACVEGVEVVSLIPNGGDAHGFEPSLTDRERLDAAALVVANGLLLEEGLTDPLEAIEDAGAAVFRATDHVDTIPYGIGAHEEADDHDGDDPHIWQDPTRVADVVPALAAALVDDAGLDAELVGACADSYVARLEALDTEVEEILAPLSASDRKLVTSHSSMGYFADRYGFEVIGTVSPSSSGLAEPNPAELEDLVALIEQAGVTAIFVDPQHSKGDAEAVAARVENLVVASLFTDALGDEGSGAETYLDLVKTNAEILVEALTGQPG